MLRVDAGALAKQQLHHLHAMTLAPLSSSSSTTCSLSLDEAAWSAVP